MEIRCPSQTTNKPNLGGFEALIEVKWAWFEQLLHGVASDSERSVIALLIQFCTPQTKCIGDH